MAPRVVLVVSADTTRAAAGPRHDYDVVARTLGATILDRRAIGTSIVARCIRAIAGVAAAQAWVAFGARRGADVIVSDGEHIGIPLALLLRLARAPVRHFTIGHRLSSKKKWLFFGALRAHERIDVIALHSRAQYEYALRTLGIGAERLALVPYQVDTEFWSPRDVPEERLVVSAGLEHRDYPTLVRAASGLDAEVMIGAASHWSRHAFEAGALPANVRTGSFDYFELRDLYARSALVVVPLHDVDNQAGITTILEAMSMGKPVVVTQSIGQTDVVQDRRSAYRGAPRPRPVSLASLLASDRGFRLEPNGFYVPPGDPDALRRAIVYLLAHPDVRRRLGAAGRRTAVELFGIGKFATRIGDIVLGLDAGGPRPLAAAVSE